MPTPFQAPGAQRRPVELRIPSEREMFDIRLSTKTLDEADVAPALWGRIQISSFIEDFIAYLCDCRPDS
jgi:hypothetical protein